MTTGQQMADATRAMDAAGIEYERFGIEFTPKLLGEPLTAGEVLAWLGGIHAKYPRPDVTG